MAGSRRPSGLVGATRSMLSPGRSRAYTAVLSRTGTTTVPFIDPVQLTVISYAADP